MPNLEIETDDVVCSHASTVSPVDEDQRFFLESRGVPTGAAERLLLGKGFFEDVADLALIRRGPETLRDPFGRPSGSPRRQVWDGGLLLSGIRACVLG
ncbi:MAG: hypothetical protein Ct9H300mP12_09550 [Acidimicrobiales bacterium]|nr:MAG: hypothetical protein Ct9H300mP12_09550 [Acidimicrobiales bacterium]